MHKLFCAFLVALLLAGIHATQILLSYRTIDTSQEPLLSINDFSEQERIRFAQNPNLKAAMILTLTRAVLSDDETTAIEEALETELTPDYYIPDFSYLIRANPLKALSALQSHSHQLPIAWIGRYKPEYKTLLDFSSRIDSGRTDVSADDSSLSFTIARLQQMSDTTSESTDTDSAVRLFAVLHQPMKSKSAQRSQRQRRVYEDMVTQWESAIRTKINQRINQDPLRSSGDADSVSLWLRLASENKLSLSIGSRRISDSRSRFTHQNKDSALAAVAEALEFLKQQEEVVWIERQPELTLNNAAARLIVHEGISELPTSAADINSRTSTKLTEAGLTGRGVVVAVGDTGIDWDMCYFNDPNHAVPFETTSNNHRKIAGYYTMSKEQDGSIISSDRRDSVNGHGSHVVGSLAGNYFFEDDNSTAAGDRKRLLQPFSGVAPDARILMIDIENSVTGRLVLPDDLYSDYFPIGYRGGARIHSNSWGCAMSLIVCRYNCECFWGQDTNFGRKGQRITDSECRALLGVNRCCELCNQYSTQSAEVDRFLSENDDSLIIFAAGNDARMSTQKSVSLPATCKNCLSVGASMTTNANFLASMQFRDYTPILNALGLPSVQRCCEYSGDLASEVKALCCPSYIQTMMGDESKFNPSNMASFSARGPTTDGRLKPDLAAPGYVVNSAHSDGLTNSFQCDPITPLMSNRAAVLAMHGTSMATPVAAGAAAIIRQYFTEGYYPTGRPTASDVMNPSGMLVKAMLIHSAELQTDGSVDIDGTGKEYAKIPKEANMYSGYGVINLSNVLKISDDQQSANSSSSRDIFVSDEKSLTNGERDVYCFKARTDTTLKATLTWFDHAGQPNTRKNLVNDLDLLAFVGMSEHSNGDHTNTVEQLTLKELTAGTEAVVVVDAYLIPAVKGSKKQRYALVVSGDVDLFTGDTCKPPPITTKTIFTVVIIGIVVLVSLVIAGTIFVIRWRRQRRFGGRRLGGGSGANRAGTGARYYRRDDEEDDDTVELQQ